MPYVKCVTSEQQNALDELKNRVKNELASPTLLEDDGLFYKFLKARGFNVDKAEKLLRKHIVWRQVHEVDTILETFKPKEIFSEDSNSGNFEAGSSSESAFEPGPSKADTPKRISLSHSAFAAFRFDISFRLFVKIVEPSVIGFDKDGDIVTYIPSGKINNTELFKCIKLNDCIKHWIWFAEKLTSLNKQRGKKTGIKAPVSLIVDLDKLEFANATSRETVNLFLRLTHLIRENYAERMKAAYVINAPSHYVFVFAIIKALMSNVMIQRIHVFGQTGWKKKFLEAIDADVLPEFLGGKRTDPDGDPYCRSFITLPGKIPESYYLSDKERYFNDPTKVSRLLIPRSEKREVSVHVKDAGSLIRWRFMATNKTIGFGLFYQKSSEYLKEIIPMYEYDTSDGTEENSYKCSFKGKYIIIFDNTQSRFSSKEVQYIVSVQNPETV